MSNLDLIIELTGFDRERVLSWSIIQAVLCAWWHVEDGLEDRTQALADFAERLYHTTL